MSRQQTFEVAPIALPPPFKDKQRMWERRETLKTGCLSHTVYLTIGNKKSIITVYTVIESSYL